MNLLNKLHVGVTNLSNLNCKTVCLLLFFVFLCWPSRFAMFYYENYNSHEIYENLFKKSTKNLSLRNVGLQCVSKTTAVTLIQ